MGDDNESGPQNAAAAIDICLMYRPDQPALYRVVIPETENQPEAKSVYPGRPV